MGGWGKFPIVGEEGFWAENEECQVECQGVGVVGILLWQSPSEMVGIGVFEDWRGGRLLVFSK